MSIGENLRKARLARGLSQVEVAQVIDRMQSVISKYENNSLQPDLETLKRLKNLYNTTYEYLLEGKRKDKKKDKTE